MELARWRAFVRLGMHHAHSQARGFTVYAFRITAFRLMVDERTLQRCTAYCKVGTAEPARHSSIEYIVDTGPVLSCHCKISGDAHARGCCLAVNK